MEIGKRPIDSLYAQAIKPIRNKMRQFNFDGLLNEILRYLNKPISTEIVEDLSALPWVVERLAIWLLSDKACFYGDRIANEADVKLLVNLAWNAIDELFSKNKNIKSLKLFVRQLFLPQMPWQTHLDHHAFILQFYLIKRLDKNSRLLSFFDKKAGMPISKYYEIGLIFWSRSISETPWFNNNYFNALKPFFSENELCVFLSSMTLTKEQLHMVLSKRTIELDEWHQPTPFYKTPCISHENAVIPFGRPCLRRYFENLMGDWLENEDISLRQSYDNIISNYVDFSFKRSGVEYLNEEQIHSLIGSNTKICDFMIIESKGYLLFEVKNKSLTKSIPTDSAPEALKAKLKNTILKGKEQLDSTRSKCADLLKFKNCTCYRIIVTNDDLWIGDIQTLIDEYNDPLPIWLLTLKDIDSLVELIVQGVETFCGFFEKVVESNKYPHLSVFSAGDLLQKPPYNQHILPKHLQEELDTTVELLKQKLSH